MMESSTVVVEKGFDDSYGSREIIIQKQLTINDKLYFTVQFELR